jgi:hypothetical protein
MRRLSAMRPFLPCDPYCSFFPTRLAPGEGGEESYDEDTLMKRPKKWSVRHWYVISVLAVLVVVVLVSRIAVACWREVSRAGAKR